MNVIDFFRGIGHVLARTFGLVKKIVPEAQLEHAIELVRMAADKFVDNTDRREWVVSELMRLFHIPESVARLIVELAVQHVKHDAIDKAAGAAEAAAAAPATS